MRLKRCGQTLEQVSVIRFLRVLFDEKLTRKHHVDKIKDKCKMVNNILEMSVWIRAMLDYGCVVHSSTAVSNHKQLDVEQAQGLRTCSGTFESLPVAAIQ